MYKAEVLSPKIIVSEIRGPQIDCDYPDIIEWSVKADVQELDSFVVEILCDESILAEIEADDDYVVFSSERVSI